MARKHMKNYSPPLIIKEMPIKATLRFHLTLSEYSYHQKYHHQQVLARIWGKRNPRTLLV
jgi:hypothetical protein